MSYGVPRNERHLLGFWKWNQDEAGTKFGFLVKISKELKRRHLLPNWRRAALMAIPKHATKEGRKENKRQ